MLNSEVVMSGKTCFSLTQGRSLTLPVLCVTQTVSLRWLAQYDYGRQQAVSKLTVCFTQEADTLPSVPNWGSPTWGNGPRAFPISVWD